MIVKGSFEDVLFVVLGLIWVVYSAYKSSNKKNEKQKQATSEGNMPESSFDDFLAEMLGAEQKEKEPEVAFVNDKEEVEKVAGNDIFSFNDKFQNEKIVEEKHFDQSGNDELIKSMEIGGENKPAKNVAFNLRKAIIYSEILERKYI